MENLNDTIDQIIILLEKFIGDDEAIITLVNRLADAGLVQVLRHKDQTGKSTSTLYVLAEFEGYTTSEENNRPNPQDKNNLPDNIKSAIILNEDIPDDIRSDIMEETGGLIDFSDEEDDYLNKKPRRKKPKKF